MPQKYKIELEPCGDLSVTLGDGPSPTFKVAQVQGAVDGTNPSFVLNPVPANGALLFKNGMAQLGASDGDYVRDGGALVFASDNIPQPEDVLQALVW